MMKGAVSQLMLACMLLGACGATNTERPPSQAIQAATRTNAPPASGAAASQAASAAAAPAQEPTMQSAQSEAVAGSPAVPLDSAIGQLVAGAKADLARRRGVTTDAIELIEARSVTWPDPSLGCPQPGMAYKQVPVDGVLIRLHVAGATFSYHGGGGRAPFLCEHPASAGSPVPAPGSSQ